MQVVKTEIRSNRVEEKTISDNCVVYKMTGVSEDGESTVYTLFPGIEVIYHDFHTAEGVSNLQQVEKMISIDYCAEGRIEWEHDDGSFCYLWEQDVQISTKIDHVDWYGFPTHHYHGITVNFFVEEATKSLNDSLPLFHIDLETLWQRYCTRKDFFILRSEKAIQDIFSDLYKNKENVSIDYLRIKIMELLIMLSRLKEVDTAAKKLYFKRSHVEKVRKIKEYLCEHTGEKITLRALAEQFEIPLPILKVCFKSIYGQSVYAFSKQFRLQKTAHLLRTTDLSITHIALDTGYENPSKFIAAFKNKFSVTPLQYRKQFYQVEHF